MRIFTVDSFTNTPFKGNPAGVCYSEDEISTEQCLKIAQEINFSETAFVYQKKGLFQLKWFTPVEEVDLCGHATLATAKILFDRLHLAKDKIEFNTKSGILTVRNLGEKLEMDFPIGRSIKIEPDSLLLEFLKEKPVEVAVHKDWCIIELNSDQSVIHFTPDLNLLLQHKRKAFVITAKSSSPEYDFVSRVFGPAIGIDEDPVTGAAHCYLAYYWNKKLNKTKLVGYQASKREGIVACEVAANNRVLLSGEAVIMSEMLIEWNK